MCWLSGHPLPEAEFLQASYPERFEREMGCTETEWLRWLPRAMGGTTCGSNYFSQWRHCFGHILGSR